MFGSLSSASGSPHFALLAISIKTGRRECTAAFKQLTGLKHHSHKRRQTQIPKKKMYKRKRAYKGTRGNSGGALTPQKRRVSTPERFGGTPHLPLISLLCDEIQTLMAITALLNKKGIESQHNHTKGRGRLCFCKQAVLRRGRAPPPFPPSSATVAANTLLTAPRAGPSGSLPGLAFERGHFGVAVHEGRRRRGGRQEARDGRGVGGGVFTEVGNFQSRVGRPISGAWGLIRTGRTLTSQRLRSGRP